MKTRIQTASPKRTRKRLQAAGLNPSKYEIGPKPGDYDDTTLDDLIKRDALEVYWARIYKAQFGGCSGCGSEERYRY